MASAAANRRPNEAPMNYLSGENPRLIRDVFPVGGGVGRRRLRARSAPTTDPADSASGGCCSMEESDCTQRLPLHASLAAVSPVDGGLRKSMVRRGQRGFRGRVQTAPLLLLLLLAGVSLPSDVVAANKLRQPQRQQQQQQQQQPQPQPQRREAACTLTAWHMSTEILSACTNSADYPAPWDDPLTDGGPHLFTSGEECCQIKYPGQPCQVMDACPTPPPTKPPSAKPTRGPRTRKPRPTNTPTPPPTPLPTTTPPGWYVAYQPKTQCVMDCVDEPNRPCGGLRKEWEVGFETADECCASIDWIDRKVCEATVPPTQRPTERPTNLAGEAQQAAGTPAPTRHYDWYLDQALQMCVQDCDDVAGYACGGLASQWAPRYPSAEECCAKTWKEYDKCAATASPTSAAPTTAPPVAPAEATMKPTKRPTEKPTQRPTFDCDAPHWYLFRTETQSICSNDPEYSSDGTTSHLIFSSPEHCCDSPFAHGDCQVIDACNPKWYADYSRGWDQGVCTHTNRGPVPRGRRTFGTEVDCCLGGFLGQSSQSCVGFMEKREEEGW